MAKLRFFTATTTLFGVQIVSLRNAITRQSAHCNRYPAFCLDSGTSGVRLAEAMSRSLLKFLKRAFALAKQGRQPPSNQALTPT
jgi:hypothetical protein